MCQGQRLGAHKTQLATFCVAILLQVISIAQTQTQLQPQLDASSSFHSQQKLPPAYVNGVLTLKGSLLANNMQLRPTNYSNTGEPNAHESNVKQNLGNMKCSQQSAEVRSPQQQQADPKQLQRDDLKDQLHKKLDELQLELRKQDDQLMQQDLQLAAQVTAAQIPVQQSMEQLQAQSLSLSPSQSQSQSVDLSQPQLEANQADGESNCYAKLQLLQQLAEYFNHGQPQQQQQPQPQQPQPQQQQQQAKQQPLGTNTAKVSTREVFLESDGNNQHLEESKATDDCGEPEESTTVSYTSVKPSKNAETKKSQPKKKLPCCKKKKQKAKGSKKKHPKEQPKEQPKELKPAQLHRIAMKPSLRIDAIANLLRYRQQRSDPLRETRNPRVDQSEKKCRKRTLEEASRVNRKPRRVITRKQMLQAEIKLWPIKISHSSS